MYYLTLPSKRPNRNPGPRPSGHNKTPTKSLNHKPKPQNLETLTLTLKGLMVFKAFWAKDPFFIRLLGYFDAKGQKPQGSRSSSHAARVSQVFVPPHLRQMV